jgi:pyruvate ferredoxin oxidoreductase gamma subunit
MYEIRIHGLGGEGVVRLSDMIGKTALRCGKWAHSFPFFGTEVRGAAVKAFTRVADNPIRIKSYIYEPDIVILTNAILAEEDETTDGIKEDGYFILNSPRAPSSRSNCKCRIIPLDATAIAYDIIGKPIVNTILFGAFLSVTGMMPLDKAAEIIGDEFEEAIAALNINALEAGFEAVKGMRDHG